MEQNRDRALLLRQLRAYQPCNEQEAKDRAVILAQLETNPEVFLRSSLTAHMTASAWVVNPARERVLMVYHNLYQSWSWLGGHADGDEDLLRVAVREVQEESGLRSVKPVSGEIYSIEILTVDGHEKRGSYVPCHLHLNVTYLLEAEDDQTLSVKADENSAVAWFTPEQAIEASTEPWFQQRIYPKLNAKLTDFPPENTEV